MSVATNGEVHLYRGVNREMHEQGIGLRPRNAERSFRREAKLDGTWNCDGSAIYGNPTSQAVHAHHRNSEAFGGPGLSFSTDEHVARRFATIGGLVSGVVYVVSLERLVALGCGIFNPCEHTSMLQHPKEAELIVVSPADAALTLADVIRVIEVD